MARAGPEGPVHGYSLLKGEQAGRLQSTRRRWRAGALLLLWAGALGSWQRDPRSLALEAFEKGDYAAARRHLERVLRQDPKEEVAHAMLGEIALAGQKPKVAVGHFRRAGKLLREDVRLQVLLGQALVGAGQPQEARRAVLAIRSEDPQALFQSGLVLAQAGDCASALERLERARGRHPEKAAVEFNLALCNHRTGRHREAVELLTGLARENAADAGVQSLLGDSLAALGKLEEAQVALERALALEQDDPRHHLALVALEIERENTERGLELVKRALERHPGEAELYGQRAILRSLGNQTRLAEADYRRALALEPEKEWLYTSLATLLAFEQDRLEEARKLLEGHRSGFRGYYVVYLYSELLRRLGEGTAAQRTMLEKSVQLNPKFAPARLNLARVYAAQGELARAREHLEATAALDPGDRRPFYELQQIYARLG
ncbi:MAG: tetratricopeptide repeat protein, partial [Acidobacteria bacterium]|nr:tetratricopeptide repeat protein [Acidobacteriota bacterium]